MKNKELYKPLNHYNMEADSSFLFPLEDQHEDNKYSSQMGKSSSSALFCCGNSSMSWSRIFWIVLLLMPYVLITMLYFLNNNGTTEKTYISSQVMRR